MIQWTTGDNDGGVDGIGGTPAFVGINKGDGVDFVNIAGSHTNDVISIDSGTNIPVPPNTMMDFVTTRGVYVIRISDGVVPTSKYSTCI